MHCYIYTTIKTTYLGCRWGINGDIGLHEGNWPVVNILTTDLRYRICGQGFPRNWSPSCRDVWHVLDSIVLTTDGVSECNRTTQGQLGCSIFWLAFWQHFDHSIYWIPKLYGKSNYQPCVFETSRDFATRRHAGYWSRPNCQCPCLWITKKQTVKYHTRPISAAFAQSSLYDMSFSCICSPWIRRHLVWYN